MMWIHNSESAIKIIIEQFSFDLLHLHDVVGFAFSWSNIHQLEQFFFIKEFLGFSGKFTDHERGTGFIEFLLKTNDGFACFFGKSLNIPQIQYYVLYCIFKEFLQSATQLCCHISRQFRRFYADDMKFLFGISFDFHIDYRKIKMRSYFAQKYFLLLLKNKESNGQ